MRFFDTNVLVYAQDDSDPRRIRIPVKAILRVN